MMRLKVPIFILSMVVACVFVLDRCKPKDATPTPPPSAENAYVGSTTCQSCHGQEHAQWKDSHHFHAMELAHDSTVRGDFSGTVLRADGVTTTFFKKEGKFFMNTQGPDGQNHVYEIKYTFGYEPLQQYLIELPGGRMQASRASWDTEKKKWFHQYAGQKLAANDWLHWTGNGQNWNTMCASCHSTDVQKNYNPADDTYQTRFNEVNVSCESCHGPGKGHLDYLATDAYRNGKKVAGSHLLLTKGSSQEELVNACGNCHGRRVDLRGSNHAGKEYLQDFVPELPTNTFFYADGQMDGEDFNYTSFLQSKMYSRGVQCTNCHNPHSGDLLFDGSRTCAQCHAPATFNTPQHTMHPEKLSATVNCISCHMPSKIYMGNDLRHDHSFRIPRPDQSETYKTPNTCNACHSDKTAAWAAAAINKHYGPNRKPHYSDHLLPGSQLGDGSEQHLQTLMKDTATPAIVRAAAIDYWSRLQTSQANEALIQYTKDPEPLVRYSALKGLKEYPYSSWVTAASPALSDPIRAVRLAAADLYTMMPAAQIPASYASAYQQANELLRGFLHYQTDFAQGNLQAGDYYRRLQNPQEAIRYYQKAIRKDSLLTLARVNLASVLNEQNRNPEALDQLLLASKMEPTSDHIFYTLGLLYAEMGEMPKAIESFKKAIQLKTNNPRTYYNYALLLQQQGKTGEAATIFEQGLQKAPTDGDLLYAAAVLYMQTGNQAKAREKALILRQYHAQNPTYEPLLRNLR
jgi:tetratricopeptide (TPR) repeat protein